MEQFILGLKRRGLLSRCSEQGLLFRGFELARLISTLQNGCTWENIPVRRSETMKFFKYSSPPAKRFLGSTRNQNPYPFYGSNIHYANPEKFRLLTINPTNVDTDRYIRRWTCYWENGGWIKLLGVQIDEKLKNCRGPSAAKLSLQFCSI